MTAELGSAGVDADPDTTGGGSVIPVCGDGLVEAWEQCDDGNRRNWDGCQWDCRLQPSMALSADRFSTCMIQEAGLKCWGKDLEGRLGYGLSTAGLCEPYRGDLTFSCEEFGVCCTGDDETPADRPFTLDGPGFLEVATGAASCALTAAQTLLCWGDGTKGQLGPEVFAQCSAQPDDAPGVDPICDESGCCIGDDEPAFAGVEIELGGVEQVVQLMDVTCALLVCGDVRCWGRSELGTLGLGSTYETAVGDDEPIDSAPLVDVGGQAVYLASGDYQTCALLDDGTVRCWGHCWSAGEFSFTGRCLGLPLEPTGDYVGDDEVPADLPPLALAGPAVHVDIGLHGGCAVLADGRVHCWGRPELAGHSYPEDGPFLRPDETEPIAFSEPAIKVTAGANCALLIDGTVVCWGTGGAWLGTASSRDAVDAELAPAAVIGGSARELDGGLQHVCVVRDDEAILCWGLSDPYWPGRLGYGDHEDIGDDETPARAGPVPVLRP